MKTLKKTFGIFHFSNYPETTWFEFAKKIAEFSKSPVKLNALTTEQYPTSAKRRREVRCVWIKLKKYIISNRSIGKTA